MADFTQGTVRAAKPLVTEGTQAVAEAGTQVLNSKQIQELAAFVKKKLGFTVPVDRMAQALQSIVSKDETLAGKLNAYRGANPSKQFNAIDSQKIRKALGKEVQDTARINRQPNIMWEDFTDSAEVINRSGFPAISGNRQPQSTISPETGLATTGQPSLRNLVEQEQNRRIGRATSAPMSQLPEKDRLAAESGQRVLEGKVIDMPGEDWKPYPRNSSSPPASASADATKSKSSLRPGVIAGSTAIMAGSGASGSWEKDEPDVPSVTPEPDEPVNPPALVDKGGAPAEATQPEAKALVQGGTEEKKSQANVNKSIQDIIDDRSKFRAAIGGRTSVDRTALLDAIKSLDTIEEELKKEQDPSKVPQLKDISAARRDALDAYKEKASMNEWLSIADRAIAAIAQFASGQAAMGTQYTGTYRPTLTDYDAKTQQALREFQAETGVLEKERAESEQQVSAYERQQEKLADRIRRQRESKVRLLEEDVRRQEREIDRADKLTADLMDNWLQTQRIESQYKKDIEREKRGEARTQAEQDKAREGVLQRDIDNTDKLLKTLIGFDSSSKKTTEAGLTKIAVELGTDKDSLIQGIVNLGEKEVDIPPRKEGMIDLLDESDKSWLKRSLIPTLIAQAKERRDRLLKEKQTLEQKRTGQQPAAAPAAAPTSAAAPTGQQPPATGTIKVRVGNQVGEIPANQLEAFKAKYPNSEVVK